LNSKIMRVLAAVTVILFLGNGAILGLIVWPAFVNVEDVAARRNVDRVVDAIQGELRALQRVARDWSAWDPTYQYVVGPNEDYDRQSFTFDVMHDLNLNLIAIYNVKGELVRSRAFDFQTDQEVSLAAFGARLAAGLSLRPRGPVGEVAGILTTERGPMLLVGFPILQSTREGPVRGSFFMGRFIDARMVADLVGQTHVGFDVQAAGSDLPAAVSGRLKKPASEGAYVADWSDRRTLESYRALPTLRGERPIVLRVETPRRITEVALTTLAIAGLSTVVTALLILAVIWLILNRHIVAPVNRLTRHVLEVGRTGDLSRRLNIDRDSEIGVLASEFDDATMKLESARQRLLEQSYQSGMADIAAGVMHNIRNALSPVAVSLWKLSESAAAEHAAFIDEALRELKAEGTAPERRRRLAEYLELAVTRMRDKSRLVADELKMIAEQNRHIEQVLHDHTALSLGVRQLESADLAKLIPEAQRLLAQRPGPRIEVSLSPQIERLPLVAGNPVVLTQILGNLMVNAAEAIAERGGAAGTIALGGDVAHEGSQDMVHLVVRDDGIGIDAATLANMFERGFSTKKGKTGGLGLHWSANSLRAMGGRMYAESDGRNAGASLHLLVPVAPQKMDCAA
jgi:sensor domain CHASE-containing protein